MRVIISLCHGESRSHIPISLSGRCFPLKVTQSRCRPDSRQHLDAQKRRCTKRHTHGDYPQVNNTLLSGNAQDRQHWSPRVTRMGKFNTIFLISTRWSIVITLLGKTLVKYFSSGLVLQVFKAIRWQKGKKRTWYKEIKLPKCILQNVEKIK